jgi:DNA-binding IclR family transcriptional regulator
VASPIFRFGEQVVAAISVTGPVTRLDPERYAPTVRLAALALSRRLVRPSAAPAAGSGRGILAR